MRIFFARRRICAYYFDGKTAGGEHHIFEACKSLRFRSLIIGTAIYSKIIVLSFYTNLCNECFLLRVMIHPPTVQGLTGWYDTLPGYFQAWNGRSKRVYAEFELDVVGYFGYGDCSRQLLIRIRNGNLLLFSRFFRTYWRVIQSGCRYLVPLT